MFRRPLVAPRARSSSSSEAPRRRDARGVRRLSGLPLVLVVLLSVALVVPACSRRRQPAESEHTAGDEASLAEVAPRVLTGALALDPAVAERVRILSQLEALCVAGSNELCNALDEDCDGRVDEGSCPYESGAVQVTMSWNSGSDVDLFVREPDGDVLSHQRDRSPRGGRFDYAGRGQCDSTMEYPRIENVSWPREQAPAGEYQLIVNRWGDCLDRATETQDFVEVIVSISVGGRLLGTLRVELGPQERFDGIRFQVTEP